MPKGVYNRKDVGGRPTKFSKELVSKLTEIFHIDGTIAEACSNAGISHDTYYKYLKREKGFAEEMIAAQQYPFILARKGLFKHVKEGDKQCIIEFMKRREKRYSDKVEENVNLNNKSKLREKDEEDLLKLLDKLEQEEKKKKKGKGVK